VYERITESRSIKSVTPPRRSAWVRSGLVSMDSGRAAGLRLVRFPALGGIGSRRSSLAEDCRAPRESTPVHNGEPTPFWFNSPEAGCHWETGLGIGALGNHIDVSSDDPKDPGRAAQSNRAKDPPRLGDP
jgi:hypothetical protein